MMTKTKTKTAKTQTLKAPFPYFGGKSKVASLVWSRLGDVSNFIEPFCGSAAMLLGRPHKPRDKPRAETVNDMNCHIANFWRAVQADPRCRGAPCELASKRGRLTCSPLVVGSFRRNQGVPRTDYGRS